MRLSTKTHLCLLATLVPIIAGCGDSSSSERSDETSLVRGNAAQINAAGEYLRIQAELDPVLIEACSDLDGLQGLSVELQMTLDANGNLLADLVAASMFEHCDFGTDYSVGPEAAVRHIADMRGMALVLRADALRFGNAGDPEGTARRLTAIIRMAQHVAQAEPFVIGKLVAFAIIGFAHESITELLSYDMLDNSARRSVRDELSRIHTVNPFDAKGALALELETAAITIRKARGYDADLQFDFSHVSDAEREKAISQAREGIERIKAVWDSPNAVDQMKDISGSMSSPIARAVVAPLAAYREQVDRASRRLREFIVELEG